MTTYSRWTNNGGQIEGPGGFPNVIALVGKVNNQSVQDTANARLIAAAPDLLAALEVGERFMAAWLADHSMDEWPLGKYEAIEIARTAIAKAKGT